MPDGNGLMQAKAASAETEREMDEQIEKIVRKAYDTCYDLLKDNAALMDTMVDALCEKETIDYDELAKMRDAHFASKPAAVAA